jgi:hypothetical protein
MTKDSTIQTKTFNPVTAVPLLERADIVRPTDGDHGMVVVPGSTDRIISHPDPRAPDAEQQALLQGKVAPGTSVGVFVTPELRKKLAPFLKARPKRGFGYVIAAGDVLDDLLQEAYEDSEDRGEDDRFDRYIAAFLEYNRHLGLKTAEALQAAVGQLLFFPELVELTEFRQALTLGTNPLNFPAIEAFLKIAGLDEAAARQFHWIAPGAHDVAVDADPVGRRREREKAGSGVRSRRLQFDQVGQNLSRLARAAGQSVLSLVERARDLQQKMTGVSAMGEDTAVRN